jgi:hypothetical protein
MYEPALTLFAMTSRTRLGRLRPTAARDEVDRNRSSYPPMFSANCRPGMARESEGRRRHLDYGEAQSFQDLPLCRFLRLIGDELDAGLAGSSGISVEDFQTHPHDPWVLAPIEHAGKIRSRIASETTYGRSAEATSCRRWKPQVSRPGLACSVQARELPSGVLPEAAVVQRPARCSVEHWVPSVALRLRPATTDAVTTVWLQRLWLWLQL